MIRSGQTVVIGGMLRDKKTTTAIKVPFLGSIPLVGLLFRRDMVVTEKFELMIFLTARVMDPNDQASVKAPEVSRLIPEEKMTADVKM